MTASLWLFLGVILIFSELLVPGFFIFFFGLGAICTAIVMFFIAIPIWVQLAIFLFVSILTLASLRRYMPKVFNGKVKTGELPDENIEFSGEPATVIEEITPEHGGKISFHGSTWNAQSDTPHAAGETVTIKSRKNLTYFVK